MSKWVNIARRSDIQNGKTGVFTVAGREIAVTFIDGAYYAYENACTHMDMPLDEGKLDGTILECPHHGAKFDLKSGVAVQMPAAAPLETFAVRVEGDHIQIELT